MNIIVPILSSICGVIFLLSPLFISMNIKKVITENPKDTNNLLKEILSIIPFIVFMVSLIAIFTGITMVEIIYY